MDFLPQMLGDSKLIPTLCPVGNKVRWHKLVVNMLYTNCIWGI